MNAIFFERLSRMGEWMQFFFKRQTARWQKQKDINTISVTNVTRDARRLRFVLEKKISRSNQEIFQVCIGIDNGNFDNV